MKSLKKILAVVLSMVLVAGISVSGTMAFLSEADADVNVMTTGNVHIKQHEYEREVDADGNYVTDATYGYKLKDFTQGKPLLPATELDANGNPYNFGAGDYDTTRVKMSQVGSHGSMDVFVNKNAQDKFVTVENTGKSDAYVRTIIAFELGSVANFRDVINTSSFMTAQGVWNVTDIGPVVIDGNNYFVSEYIYNGGKSLGGVHENGVLPAGDTTYPSLAQVYMKATATNEDVEKIDGNKNGTYEILVLSQAVQVDGFADAKTALDTAFGKSSEKAAVWFGGDEFEAPVMVSNNEELDAALKAGKTSILMAEGTYQMPASAKAKVLTLTGSGKNTVIEVVGAGQGEANGQLDYNLDGSTVTFNNLTIKTNNQTYAGYARLKATFNNCVMDQCFCLNGDSTFYGCTFNVSGNQYNVWTWGAPNATFDNCTFNSDGKAILLYGQANTNLVVNKCTFNDNGGLTDLKAAIEIGNDYNKSYTVTVTDTTVNGYEINDKGINTGSTLWGNKNSMPKDKLNVVVDGVDVY